MFAVEFNDGCPLHVIAYALTLSRCEWLVLNQAVGFVGSELFSRLYSRPLLMKQHFVANCSCRSTLAPLETVY